MPANWNSLLTAPFYVFSVKISPLAPQKKATRTLAILPSLVYSFFFWPLRTSLTFGGVQSPIWNVSYISSTVLGILWNCRISCYPSTYYKNCNYSASECRCISILLFKKICPLHYIVIFMREGYICVWFISIFSFLKGT